MMSMEKVAKQVGILIYEELENVLQQIATDYKLDFNTLMTKYAVTYSQQAGAGIEKVGGGGGKNKKTKTKTTSSCNDDYIETEEFEYNGKKYLVDTNNIVYTNDVDRPMVVGERLVNGSIKFKR